MSPEVQEYLKGPTPYLPPDPSVPLDWPFPLEQKEKQ